jgi:hypothetical protein
VSCDPASVAGGINLYGYAENSPTRFMDQTGMQPHLEDTEIHQGWVEGKPAAGLPNDVATGAAPNTAAAAGGNAPVEPDIVVEVPIVGPAIDASKSNRGYDKKMADVAIRNRARMAGKDPKNYHLGHKKPHSILMPGEKTRGVPEPKVTPDKKGNLNKSGVERVEAARRRAAAESQGEKAWESTDPNEFARPGEQEHAQMRAASKSAGKSASPKAQAQAPKAAPAEPTTPAPVEPTVAPKAAAPEPLATPSPKPTGPEGLPEPGAGGNGVVGGALSLAPAVALGIAQYSAQSRMDEAARQRATNKGTPTQEQIELQESCGYHFTGKFDGDGKPVWQYKPSAWQNFRWNFLELMDPFGGPQPGGSQNVGDWRS